MTTRNTAVTTKNVVKNNTATNNIATNNLLLRAKTLKLHGLIAHWADVEQQSWINDLIAWEETERSERSLERRLNSCLLYTSPSPRDS